MMPVFSEYRQDNPFYIEDVNASTGEVTSTIFGESGLTKRILDATTLSFAEDFGGFTIDPEEAKKIVGDTPVKLDYSQPLRRDYVEMLVQHKKDEMRRSRILERAKNDLSTKVFSLTAGLAASLVDPVEVGASVVVPGYAETKYARLLGKAATPFERALVRFQYGARGGLAGTAAIEPISYGVSNYLQEDYTLKDSFTNLVFGSILGGGLHTIGGAIKDGFFRPPEKAPTPHIIDNLHPETQQAAFRTAFDQFNEGRHIDVESILKSDPRYNYILGKTPDLPEGIGGRKLSDVYGIGPKHEIVKTVDERVNLALDQHEQDINARYEGQILPKHEVDALQGKIKNLEHDLEQAQTGKSKAIKQRKLRTQIQDVKDAIAKQKELRTARTEELGQINKAREVLSKDKPHVGDLPPIARDILDSELQVHHQNAVQQKLSDVINASNKAGTYDAFNHYPTREELHTTKTKAAEHQKMTPEDEIQKSLDDIQTDIKPLSEDLNFKDSVDTIEREFKDDEQAVSDIETALKQHLLCRSTNG